MTIEKDNNNTAEKAEIETQLSVEEQVATSKTEPKAKPRKKAE